MLRASTGALYLHQDTKEHISMDSPASGPSRLRIVLLPPFQSAKYLLPIPRSVIKISHLVRHLISTLPNISSLVKHEDEICLEVDGFEVIEGPLSTLREQDVIR